MSGISGYTISRKNQSSCLDSKYDIHEELTENIADTFANIQVNYHDFQKNNKFVFEDNQLKIIVYGDPLINGLTGDEAIQKTIKIIKRSKPHFKAVADIDGLFTAVVIDRDRKKLYLITDRNGLQHCFFGLFKDELHWSNKLNFFEKTQYKLTLNHESIYAFLELGYLIENSTWFNEVNLVPPSSFLEWDLSKEELVGVFQYWEHERNPEKSSKTRNQIINDLHELFSQAVQTSTNENENIGITLSGGQDSRALFAAFPQQRYFTAVTRGMKGCGDIVLAKKVASLNNFCSHKIFDLNENNWLEGRLEAILETSGQKNLFDMNVIPSLPLFKTSCDINLDGTGGDGIFQGSHLGYMKSKKAEDKVVANYINYNLEEETNTARHLIDYYNHIGSDLFFYIYQRVRRFVCFGGKLGDPYGVVNRYPFLNKKLIDYTQTVEDKHLFQVMLVKFYPEFFRSINHMRLGAPLSESKIVNEYSLFVRRVKKVIGAKTYRAVYHDYPTWLKKDHYYLINDLILDKNNPLYNIVDYEKIQNLLNESNKPTALHSRVITLNYYLNNLSI